jgi:hypothetical protein
VNFGDQLIGVDGDDREGSQPLAGSRILPTFPKPPSPNRKPVPSSFPHIPPSPNRSPFRIAMAKGCFILPLAAFHSKKPSTDAAAPAISITEANLAEFLYARE